jgi:hypothetical protein
MALLWLNVSLNVNIADCRGQGYDNGTNMRGKNKVCSAESWM